MQILLVTDTNSKSYDLAFFKNIYEEISLIVIKVTNRKAEKPWFGDRHCSLICLRKIAQIHAAKLLVKFYVQFLRI